MSAGRAPPSSCELPLAARCRLAFLTGTLEAWREANGIDPPPEVLAQLLRRYPGDPDVITERLDRARRS